MARDNVKSGFCKDCGERRRVTRPGTRHLMHFILTLLTVGVWLPIWLLCSIRIGGWRCGQCGSKRVNQVR